MKKAIVLGASRGIGKSISDSLKKLDLDVISLSSNDIDTSNLNSVNKFANENNSHCAEIGRDQMVEDDIDEPFKRRNRQQVINLNFFFNTQLTSLDIFLLF